MALSENRRATNAGGTAGRDECAMNERERIRSSRLLCNRLLSGERRPWRLSERCRPRCCCSHGRGARRRGAAGRCAPWAASDSRSLGCAAGLPRLRCQITPLGITVRAAARLPPYRYPAQQVRCLALLVEERGGSVRGEQSGASEVRPPAAPWTSYSARVRPEHYLRHERRERRAVARGMAAKRHERSLTASSRPQRTCFAVFWRRCREGASLSFLVVNGSILPSRND